MSEAIKEAEKILKQYYGYDHFREGQIPVIKAVLGGRDVLGIMPTGAGKSVCYQVPALMMKGITIVISPLISLMRDQVDALNDVGLPAAFINTTQTPDEQDLVFAQALSDSLLLHISKSVILDELERDPKLGRKMIASLSMRLHHLITDVESYSLHSGRQRIIGYLLRDNMESDAQSLTVTLPTSKGVIASRLNLTQEHFSRILHELQENGLITVQGRKIGIPNVEKLRGYDL